MLHTSAWDRHTSTNLWLIKSFYYAAQTSAKLSFFYVWVSWSWYLRRRGHMSWLRTAGRSVAVIRQIHSVRRSVTWLVARCVACPDAARLQTDVCSADLRVSDVSRLTAATLFCDDLGHVGRRTQLPLSGRPCLYCCHTSCLEQPAGGGAVVHIVPAVLTSSRGWLFRRPLGPWTEPHVTIVKLLRDLVDFTTLCHV